MKKYLFIVFFALILFFAPRVNAKSFNVVAGAGRSAVMNPSGTYYYTQWKGLSSDSLNILPIPYPNGDYYLMGSEYSFAITLTGEKSFRGHVTIPVAANTIYNYTMTNGLLQADGAADLHFGIDQNFGVYNMGLGAWNATWSCNTYTNNLGVAHNLCFYDIEFSFSTDTNYEGAYNLNVAVLNTTGNRSAYYFSGIDSNGNGIEFPVNASGTQYSTVRPYLSMTGVSGDSSSPDNTEEILNGVSQASAEISQTIQESYENLVKSQEVCNTYSLTSFPVVIDNSLIANSNGGTSSSNNWYLSNYYYVNKGNSYTYSTSRTSSAAYWCLYDLSYNVISCSATNSSNTFTPTQDGYFRASVGKGNYTFSFVGDYCQNGNQAIYDELHDSSIDTHSANSFFESMDFYEDATLSSVITAPLDFINSLDDGCTPVVLTYRGQSITLPCGDTIFWNRDDVSTFRAFWNALFGGLILYRLVRRLFLVVNDAMNPEKDTIGGLDL